MALKLLLLALIFFVTKTVYKGWLLSNEMQKQKPTQKKKNPSGDVFDAEYRVVQED
jgi:hypothetical protein